MQDRSTSDESPTRSGVAQNDPSNWSIWRDGLGFGIAALGIAICVSAYLAQLSLFIDEVNLLRSVIGRGLTQWLEPLTNDQAAPVGYVILLGASIAAWGEQELAFRLVSVIAACLSMPLFWLFIRRLVGGWPALAGMLIFAVNSTLAYYAQQTKQYTLELFIALLLLLLTQWVCRSRLTVIRLLLLAGAGLIATWFSASAIFILAGCGVALLVTAWKRPVGRGWSLPTIFAMGVIWIASFFAHYHSVLRHYSDDDFLVGYWRPFYLRLVPTRPDKLLDQLAAVFINPVDLTMYQLGWIVWVVGMIVLAIHQRTAIGYGLISAWLGLALAAVLEIYPYGDRLILFALPLLIGPLAVGISYLWMQRSWAFRLAAIGIAAVLLAQPVLTGGGIKADDDIKLVLEELDQQLIPEDVVWLNRNASAVQSFYTERLDKFHLKPAWVFHSNVRPADYVKRIDEVWQFAGRDRVWIVITHAEEVGPVNTRQHILDIFNHRAIRLAEIHSDDATATLYDLSDLPPLDPPAPKTDGALDGSMR